MLFSVYHLPLFDFLNLITINCECQYFVKRFLKYFFVSVNLLTLNSLLQYVVIVNTKNTIFLKKILILFYQTSVRLIFIEQIQLERIIQIKTYVRISVKWEKTELFILGVLKTRTSVLFSGQPRSYFIHIQR